jgi:hypothetical protein
MNLDVESDEHERSRNHTENWRDPKKCSGIESIIEKETISLSKRSIPKEKPLPMENS